MSRFYTILLLKVNTAQFFNRNRFFIVIISFSVCYYNLKYFSDKEMKKINATLFKIIYCTDQLHSQE